MGFDRRVDRTAVPMTDHQDQLQTSGSRGIADRGELVQGVDHAADALIAEDVARDPDREQVVEPLPEKDLGGLPRVRTSQDQGERTLLRPAVGIVLPETDLGLVAGDDDRLLGDRLPAVVHESREVGIPCPQPVHRQLLGGGRLRSLGFGVVEAVAMDELDVFAAQSVRRR